MGGLSDVEVRMLMEEGIGGSQVWANGTMVEWKVVAGRFGPDEGRRRS